MGLWALSALSVKVGAGMRCRSSQIRLLICCRCRPTSSFRASTRVVFRVTRAYMERRWDSSASALPSCASEGAPSKPSSDRIRSSTCVSACKARLLVTLASRLSGTLVTAPDVVERGRTVGKILTEVWSPTSASTTGDVAGVPFGGAESWIREKLSRRSPIARGSGVGTGDISLTDRGVNIILDGSGASPTRTDAKRLVERSSIEGAGAIHSNVSPGQAGDDE